MESQAPKVVGVIGGMGPEQAPKVVGVIGGMGPEATVLLMSRVISLVNAKDDKDHVPLLVDQNTQIPSRIKALIEGNGEDPTPVLEDMARRLEVQGAQAIVMPCNTAHYYAPSIKAAVTVPVLDMVALSAKHASKQHFQHVGILGSPAVKQTGVFARAFEAYGTELIWPENQDALLVAIRKIKKDSNDESAKVILRAAADELLHAGADCLLVACSEMSIVISDIIPAKAACIDTIDVLAREIVTFSHGFHRSIAEEARKRADHAEFVAKERKKRHDEHVKEIKLKGLGHLQTQEERAQHRAKQPVLGSQTARELRDAVSLKEEEKGRAQHRKSASKLHHALVLKKAAKEREAHAKSREAHKQISSGHGNAIAEEASKRAKHAEHVANERKKRRNTHFGHIKQRGQAHLESQEQKAEHRAKQPALHVSAASELLATVHDRAVAKGRAAHKDMINAHAAAIALEAKKRTDHAEHVANERKKRGNMHFHHIKFHGQAHLEKQEQKVGDRANQPKLGSPAVKELRKAVQKKEEAKARAAHMQISSGHGNAIAEEASKRAKHAEHVANERKKRRNTHFGHIKQRGQAHLESQEQKAEHRAKQPALHVSAASELLATVHDKAVAKGRAAHKDMIKSQHAEILMKSNSL